MQRFNWLLDNGHGKETGGKRSPKLSCGRQLFEYEYNRDIVRRVADLLKKAYVEHTILVPEITDISLSERCRRANNLKSTLPKILISVHANAAGDGVAFNTACGFEVFTTPGNTQSDKVAEVFFQTFKVSFPACKMRADLTDGDSDKEANLYILKNTSCPAILLENGFMTNRDEAELLLNPQYRQMQSQTIANAILHIEKHGL